MFIDWKCLLLFKIPGDSERKQKSTSSMLRAAIKGNNVVKGEFTLVFPQKAATETTLLRRLEYINLFSLIHSIVFLEMFHSPK